MDNLSIITIIFAVMAIILSFQNNRLQKKIAANQGVFRNPNLMISIYDSERSSRVHFIPEYFILACKISNKRILDFPLRITLNNNGDKSAKKCKLLLRYPKILRFNGLVEMQTKDNYSKERAPKLINDSNFQTAIFEIGTITPKEALVLHDAITISGATSHKMDVDVVSKDDIPYTVGVEFDWFFNIDYTVYQDNAEPISGRIKLKIVDISKQSLKGYFNYINKKNSEIYKDKVGNKINHILYCLKLKITGTKTEITIQLIVYDESQVEHGEITDRIPYSAFKYYYGLEDVTGSIHIPKITFPK
jgi:hypothetical protein